MTRAELVTTVSKMIHDSLLDRVTPWELAKEIIDKVEPLIRADERAHGWQEGYDAGIAYAVEKYQHTWSTRLAELREKVEALREQTMVFVLERKGGAAAIYAYDNVLALIDGDSDE